VTVEYHDVGGTARELILAAGLDPNAVSSLVRTALDEDLAYGPDVTTAATVPGDQWVEASIGARGGGVVAGLPLAIATFDQVLGPDGWRQVSRLDDGTVVQPGDEVIVVQAQTRGLLTAERTALNFLCHLSGVATLTAAWAAAVAPARVRDTRKTLPGLRLLEKYAVRCGGGVNHRMGLGDAALIKDNHVVAAGGVAEAVAAVRAVAPLTPLEVECDRVSQVREAIAAGAQLILLDNMTVEEMQEAVTLGPREPQQVRFEASGGLTLAAASAVATTGVDFVAVGALTHSAPVLDLGLDVRRVISGSLRSSGD
jgi:nicotinate-nucleotide pyrophosphorylase (carboxylating)